MSSAGACGVGGLLRSCSGRRARRGVARGARRDRDEHSHGAGINFKSSAERASPLFALANACWICELLWNNLAQGTCITGRTGGMLYKARAFEIKSSSSQSPFTALERNKSWAARITPIVFISDTHFCRTPQFHSI
jgi:hypothetical protein